MADSLRDARYRINDAPDLAPTPEDVRAALDGIRPGLLADGGNVELRGVEDDGTIRLELQGACTSCPAREMTLRRVLEPYLRETFPGCTGVIDA